MWDRSVTIGPLDMLFCHRNRKKSPCAKAKPMAAVLPKKDCCKYPIGDPRDKNFSFCNKPREKTSPYCVAHENVCYERKAESPEKRQRALARIKQNW